MGYSVVFSRHARREVDEKEEWLGRLGSDTVARWRAKLFGAVARLESDPLVYPLIDEATELGADFRETLFGKRRHVYRLIDSVDEPSKTVHVHHVRHSAQDRLSPDDL